MTSVALSPISLTFVDSLLSPVTFLVVSPDPTP